MDTEFLDTGSAIDLVSIGLVAEDGRELYLQSVEFDPIKANGWIRENVLPHLKICHSSGKWNLDQSLYSWERCEKPDCAWRTREQIRDEVLAFLDVEKYGALDIIGWCAAYDWVVFCQLFGTMMDIPQGYPHYIRDLQHILDERGISDDQLPPQENGTHNALEDARHIKKLWGYIVRNDAWQ